MNRITFLNAVTVFVLSASISCAFGAAADSQQNSAIVRFTVLDQVAAAPVHCRIHLTGPDSKPVLPEHLPSFHDHFCFDGDEQISLTPGTYTYVIERGPEYTRDSGTFQAQEGTRIDVNSTIRRIADLAADGWWSGDLHIHRPPKDIELLVKAEDLHVAPIITWWNASNAWKDAQLPAPTVRKFDDSCFCDLIAGEDERQGGAFMYFNVDSPLDITSAQPEYPCPLQFIEEALKQPSAWIDIEKPFWWDVPVALAHGYGNSIGLANNHCNHAGMLDSEAWGKPRDRQEFPSPHGNGLWTQQIYYHILNTGIRIPPSAGSASGVLPNPVGYNRVYVYTGEKRLNYENWWQNLRAGRCFVTNGPLIRTQANGQIPGHIFKQPGGQDLNLTINLQIQTNDPIDRIEIIKNGIVEKTVANVQDPVATLTFNKSGWFLIRAIADVPNTFRFASTAPYYVEIGDNKQLISRNSAQFFLDWTKERIARIKIEDKEKYRQVIKYHNRAQEFWQTKLASANAE